MAALVVAVLTASAPGADNRADNRSADRAPTLEQLELQHLMEQATQAFENQALPMEEISADFRYRCLRATGADAFCECLVEKRPYSLRFEHYVRIASRTKSELGYAHLRGDGRRLVDRVYAVRDACVSLEPGPPADR